MTSAAQPGPRRRYVLTESDLRFLGLTALEIKDAVMHNCPLGMRTAEFEEFQRGLYHALENDHITDADVRLQGSSAQIFSSRHKLLPETQEDVYQIMIDEREHLPIVERLPSTLELSRCATKLFVQWPASRTRPYCRPFDSLFICGISLSPSDYDLQIASDQMVMRVREELRFQGLDASKITVNDKHYNFVQKHFTERFFPHVSMWCGRMSVDVNRPVTWALFPSAGPARNGESPKLSSHFRARDWILEPPTATSQVSA